MGWFLLEYKKNNFDKNISFILSVGNFGGFKEECAIFVSGMFYFGYKRFRGKNGRTQRLSWLYRGQDENQNSVRDFKQSFRGGGPIN